ncbi:MAG: hypothetical protein LBQ31_02775, partial [Bacteroidales bacterium]|nr:hypothetical protein [Bacteroidales bacterium]
MKKKLLKFFSVTSLLKNKLLESLLVIAVSCSVYQATAQSSYPIYVQPTLTPPYSLRLSDYGQPGNQKLVVMIQVRDVTVTSLPIRLHIKMETIDGRGIETVPNIIVMPTYVGGGETTIFFGEDLAPYFNPDNLVFKGYTKEQYRRTGQLPEGFYRVTVEVRHSMTGRLISNRGTAMGWFALGKPPLLKLPATDVELGQIAGIPLTFTWETSNIGIPGANVQYTFELWELRLDGINPNAIVTTMPPYHTTTQFHNTLVVHPSILNLEPGMRYAWRVTASDLMNQVPFEQDGHSEVRIFTYMCKCDTTRNLKVEQKGKDAIYSWSTADRHTSFTIEAENITTGYNRRDVVYDNKYKLQGLNYDQEYRLRVQAVCDGNTQYPSEFSAWKKFKLTPPPTPEEICPECSCDIGDKKPKEITNFNLKELKAGDTVRYGLTRLIIESAHSTGNKVYEGNLLWWWEFKGVKFRAKYWNFTVNTENEVLDGSYKTIYSPDLLVDVDAIKDALDNMNNDDDNNQNQNSDTIKVDFAILDNPQITYNDTAGTITIIDEDGNPQTIELPKDEDGNTDFPVTIVDNNNNTYEITKDENGNVTIQKKENIDTDNIEQSKSKSFYRVEGYDFYNRETIFLPRSKKRYKIEAYKDSVTKFDGSSVWSSIVTVIDSATASYIPDTASSNMNGRILSITSHSDTLRCNIVVVDVRFEEDPNQKWGFDENNPYENLYPSYAEYNDRGIPWKSLKKDGSDDDLVRVIVRPIGAENRVSFLTSNHSITIDNLTSSNGSVRLSSSIDSGYIWVKVDNFVNDSMRLNIAAYELKTVDIKIVNIDEENDDVQLVRPGDITASATTPVVSCGNNDFLDSKVGGDDRIVGNNIVAGENKICETKANDSNIVSTNLSLSDFKNTINSIYKQAVVEVNITYDTIHKVINYDLNRDSMIETGNNGER